jgi:hypothetical protein
VTDRTPTASTHARRARPFCALAGLPGRLPLRPCGTGGILRPYDSSPQALRAGLAGPKIRLLLNRRPLRG